MRKKRNQVSGGPTVHQPRGQTVLRRVLRRTLLQTVCRLLETHHRSVGELFQLLISLCDPSQLYCSCGLMDSSGNILTDLSKVDFLPSTILHSLQWHHCWLLLAQIAVSCVCEVGSKEKGDASELNYRWVQKIICITPVVYFHQLLFASTDLESASNVFACLSRITFPDKPRKRSDTLGD